MDQPHSQRVKLSLPNIFPPAEVVASNVEIDPAVGPPPWVRVHYERNLSLVSNPEFMDLINQMERQAFINLSTMATNAPEFALRHALTAYQAIVSIPKNIVGQMEAYEQAARQSEELRKLQEQAAAQK